MTLVAVAYFKNPVNIWIPSSLSKLQMMDLNVKLVSSIDNAVFYGKESGMFTETDEEYEGRVF